ncbi:MAG: PP0621 family protein [Bacteroidota bacterium]
MKYLLLVALFVAIWWSWNKRRIGTGGDRPRTDPPVENMVVCTHCGVHLPESDSLKEGAKVYCSEAHRLAARAAGH